jgi:spermine oxidase
LKKVKGSLGNYVITQYKQALKTPEFSDIDEEEAYQVLEYIHKFENSIDASDTWFDSSASGLTEYWECDGHPLLNWRDKGYKHIIDFITKKKPDPSKAIDIESRTIFNKEVSNIKWNGNNQIVIKCSDGSSYDCDHVVVTCSLGVLKENYMTMFTPELPKLKTNAIEGLSIGTVDKIFLEFEKPFWGDDWTGMSFLWSQKDSKEIRSTPNAWLEDVFGFYIVDHQPNILCGWIGGPSARIMETLNNDKILEGCLFLFNKFIGSKMPWTKPKNMIVSRWNSNPHFRGSYSFRSVTTDFLKTSARDLSIPLHDSLGKPVVCFAGEATHDHYYSTVHGALESGRREADRLANYYIG